MTKRSKCVQCALCWGMADIPGSDITKPFKDLLVCGMIPIKIAHKYGIKRSWMIKPFPAENPEETKVPRTIKLLFFGQELIKKY